MAKLRPIPAEYESGSRVPVVRKVLASGETFKAGDFVEMDASNDITEVSGTDPTPLYGLAAENAADVLYSGYVQVHPFTDDWKFWISANSATLAEATHVDNDYGIVEDGDGVYCLDVSETSNTRVRVHDIDTERNMALCSVLAAHREYTV